MRFVEFCWVGVIFIRSFPSVYHTNLTILVPGTITVRILTAKAKVSKRDDIQMTSWNAPLPGEVGNVKEIFRMPQYYRVCRTCGIFPGTTYQIMLLTNHSFDRISCDITTIGSWPHIHIKSDSTSDSKHVVGKLFSNLRCLHCTKYVPWYGHSNTTVDTTRNCWTKLWNHTSMRRSLQRLASVQGPKGGKYITQ